VKYGLKYLLREIQPGSIINLLSSMRLMAAINIRL